MAVGACAIEPVDDTASGGLVETSWTVVSIDGAPTLPDSPPTLDFTPDGLSGTTGCNRYGGTFRTERDAFSAVLGVMTEIDCDDPRSAQEAAFVAALAKVDRWRLREDGALELRGASTIVARPAIAP
ncbi:MAG: META domain-containing protein [Candidatus Limnocylindria bacterium]